MTQTTETQPFKVDWFSSKTLEFQHDDVIIYEFRKFVLCVE